MHVAPRWWLAHGDSAEVLTLHDRARAARQPAAWVETTDGRAVVEFAVAEREGRFLAARWLNRAADQLLRDCGFDPPMRFVDSVRVFIARSLWEADHIVPVVEGGGGCGLENYRTLCVPCHRRETAALARRRAVERRAQRPLFGGDA